VFGRGARAEKAGPKDIQAESVNQINSKKLWILLLILLKLHSLPDSSHAFTIFILNPAPKI
jgi:hypothetical protein